MAACLTGPEYAKEESVRHTQKQQRRPTCLTPRRKVRKEGFKAGVGSGLSGRITSSAPASCLISHHDAI